MKAAAPAILAALPIVALWALPAAAEGFDQGQAKSRIEAAGYADVAEVHEGNLGEWMAQATKDGQHVMVVLHEDGSVALRQQVDTPPALSVTPPAKP